MWGKDIDHGLGRTVPRSYQLPYSTKLHDSVDKNNLIPRKGLPVISQVKAAVANKNELSTLKQTQTQTGNIGIVFIDAPQGLL